MQAILLNFVVSFAVWGSVHFNALSLASITAKASSEFQNTDLSNVLPEEITNELKKIEDEKKESI
ncbi:MAG TPA: hypothetical protein PK079_24940 [Leptospiraceae bacterium]|nr:hypothetical protein [Leptospiraceae bacterium]HMW08478.1 hypothetical protein [Leptospiraceae bacterium]HMX33939.1 hypothetical protein [Leptospiraceae bacterium]HMY34238.1 hypothetical protein [Leptospiraceae bacterium]HMZ67369.1 hypothetical protein [Leptospiraceae bacterium]